MFKTLQDKFGHQFLKSEGRGFAAAVKLSPFITVTTSNPKTFEHLTGEKVDRSKGKPAYKARKSSAARTVNTVPAHA